MKITPHSVDELLAENAADAQERGQRSILEMLYRNHRSAAVVMVLNSTVVAYLLGAQQGVSQVMGWWLIGLGLGAIRFSLTAAYHRWRNHLSPRRWSQIAAATSLSFGLQIAYLNLFLFASAEPAGQTAIAVLTAGTIAGATIAGATYLPCFIAFTLPASTAMALAFALHLGASGPGLVMFDLVYVSMMFLSTRRINQLIQRNVRLSTALYRQARRDPLVGVANRLEFNRRTSEAVHEARKSADDAALIFIDLDHFKQLNDAHGHPAGDQALLSVAESVTDALRPEDLVARLGGDEFVVFLYPASRTAALTAANKALEAVRSIRLRIGQGESLKVSASIGLAYSLGGFTSTESLLSRADAAVYLAKERGRDRVEALALESWGVDTPADNASTPPEHSRARLA